MTSLTSKCETWQNLVTTIWHFSQLNGARKWPDFPELNRQRVDLYATEVKDGIFAPDYILGNRPESL